MTQHQDQPDSREDLEEHEVAALQRLEVFKFLDHSADKDWLPVDQLRTDPQVVISVGVAVRETDTVVVVAPTLTDTDLPMSEWVVAEATMILKALLIYRAPLVKATTPLARSGEAG